VNHRKGVSTLTYIFTLAGNKIHINGPEDLADVPTATLVAEYNLLAGKDIEKFESRETAIRRTWELMEKAAVSVPATEPKRKKTRRDQTITIVADKKRLHR
jgi:hypothetical protein